MALITPGLLDALFVGFRGEFNREFEKTPTAWDKVATRLSSTSKANIYGWLGQFPQFREWVGERVVRDMKAHAYSITNKKYESTVSVSRVDIEDDQIGVYKPIFGEMGRAAKNLVVKDERTINFNAQLFVDGHEMARVVNKHNMADAKRE